MTREFELTEEQKKEKEELRNRCSETEKKIVIISFLCACGNMISADYKNTTEIECPQCHQKYAMSFKDSEIKVTKAE